MGSNIPPNGLFGRRNGQFRAPVAIHERYDDSGTLRWREADFVWVAGDGIGEWHLLWAATAGSPASVSASYSPTQVNVSWVHDDPKVAEQYRIYRPDGSLAGTVSSTETTFIDYDPRPLVGAYEVRGVVGGVPADVGTFSSSLDLTLHATNFSGSYGAGAVELTWTAPTLGIPDQWQLLVNNVVVGTKAGNETSWTVSSIVRGEANTFELRAVLSGIVAASGASDSVNVPALPPTGVALNATTSPLANLRLSWSHPSGSRTGYEVQVYPVGGPWTAHESVASSGTQSDWSTADPGYMRVRTLSAGGSSDWVQLGPVVPIVDITPPANAVVTSWKPESSYGRMVVRFTTPADADFAQYRVQERVGAGSWTNVGSWTNAAPSTNYAVVCSTRSEGQTAGVRILVRDNAVPTPNESVGSEHTYTLGPSEIIVDPSGDLSGTYRGTGWRDDGTRAEDEIATGWTSSGHNIGCWFYGTSIATALSGKDVVSATIEYWRENAGGQSSGVQPLFWTHALEGRSGAPVPNAHGVAEASRLGSAVARRTDISPFVTSGTFSLPAAFISALKAGTAKGLCAYRGYAGSGDPDNYYMFLSVGGVVGGSPSKTNGRLRFQTLG